MALTRSQKRELQQAKADMAELLASPAGRRFFVRLLDATAFNALNPGLSGLLEGRRAVGEWLINEMSNADILSYPSLLHDAILLRRQAGRDDIAAPAGDDQLNEDTE